MANNQIQKHNRTTKGAIIDELHEGNVLIDTREIFLHSYIGAHDDPGIDYRMCNQFLKNVRLLESFNDSPIIVHIQTDGGEWYAGMMIYDIIANCSIPIAIICHGNVCSMGTLIVQAADLRLIMPHCGWMIHDGSPSLAADTFKQGQSNAALEQLMCKTSMNIYIEAVRNSAMLTDKTDRQIQLHIQRKLDRHEDWWLSAEECIDYGFVDGIFGEKYSTIMGIRESLV